MEAEDNYGRVKFSAIADFFSCPVCMCEFQETCITPCGHRFCLKCIGEFLTIKDQCPCCNRKIGNDSMLMKDPHYDLLIAKLADERKKAETNYFNNLISASSDAERAVMAHTECLTELQQVLKKHLHKASLDHEDYLKELEKSSSVEEHKIRADYDQRVDCIKSLVSEVEVRDTEIARLRKEEETLRNQVQGRLTDLKRHVCEALDRYLSEHIPRMSILPVNVSISVLHKNITFENIKIQPTDSLTDIRKIVKRQMEKLGNKVQTFGDDVGFYAFKPLQNCSVHEMLDMIDRPANRGSSHPLFYLLSEDHQLVLEGKLQHGCHIAVYGQVECESDQPKNCFSKTFVKGRSQSEDYFQCDTCSFTWICRSCSEVCHKGHKLTTYILNHVPSWGCCYCPKKSECTFCSTSSQEI